MTSQIIRTQQELEALDLFTVLWTRFDDLRTSYECSEFDLPAVAIATGDEVRAAKKALQEEP